MTRTRPGDDPKKRGEHRQRRRYAAAGVLMMLSLGACSSGSDTPDTSSTDTVKVTITEQDGNVSADTDLAKATVGHKIQFVVTTDAADEIHVHSVPDQEFALEPGPAQTFTFSVKTPGTVEVESHELGTTILKLEIS